VVAIYGKGSESEMTTVLKDTVDRIYAKGTTKPVFTLKPSDPVDSSQKTSGTPSQLIVFYKDTELPALDRAAILEILESQGNERGGLDFQYQVFSAGR
jgi:hypothetical protein